MHITADTELVGSLGWPTASLHFRRTLFVLDTLSGFLLETADILNEAAAGAFNLHIVNDPAEQ